MCKYLIGKHNMQPHIAQEDIPVLKGVKLLPDGRWAGLYRNSYTAATGKVISAEGNARMNTNGDLWACVEGGMFHSCTDLNAFVPRRTDFYPDHSIVRAIIPKGTKYFVTKVGNDICSEKLIVTTEEVVNCRDMKLYSPEFMQMLEFAPTVEVVEAKGKEWLHVKNHEHEVFLSLVDVGYGYWSTCKRLAIEYGGILPNTDDWDLINKYRHQVDPILEHLPQAKDLKRAYWSLSECYNVSAWFYYGHSGRFGGGDEIDSFTCRSVLALES